MRKIPLGPTSIGGNKWCKHITMLNIEFHFKQRIEDERLEKIKSKAYFQRLCQR